jgi:putative ATP-binding cassette transporter
MNISKGHTGRYVYFTFMSIVAASGNMGIVYMINRIIDTYFTGKGFLLNQFLLYFLAAILIFFTCRWLVSISIIYFTQKLLRNTRMNVLKIVLRSSFLSLVRNKAFIFSALTRDTDIIVAASINLVDILTNTVVVAICFVYMGVLSWKLLLCMLGIICFTLLIYLLSEKRAQVLFEKAMKQNDLFIKYLNEILAGYKEITMERLKGIEITDRHVKGAIESGSMLNQKAQVSFLNNRIIGQISFYMFIGILLLFLGNAFGASKPVLVNFIFLILYIWGPIEGLVLQIPNLSQAKISLRRLNELERRIEEEAPETGVTSAYTSFAILSLQGISYQYDKELNTNESFGIGPIDFQVTPGEITFISGGNGSGKTTFVNVLIGLFMCDEGDIYVDGEKIDKTRLSGYRSLFTVVFSDFHLFDECYGVAPVDKDKVKEYLEILEIDQKVTLEGTKFSTIDLSTGQRKRLALCHALLEQKPILILDEFAADQDPYFKRKFYSEILPYIKAQGFTVIAITHDDNYYSYADKLYKMESGKLFRMDVESRFFQTALFDK